MKEREVWICCVCNQAMDDRQINEQAPGAGFKQWVSLSSYLSLYRVPRDAVKLIQTLCPLCSEKFRRYSSIAERIRCLETRVFPSRQIAPVVEYTATSEQSREI
jgi:hypothetical protein